MHGLRLVSDQNPTDLLALVDRYADTFHSGDTSNTYRSRLTQMVRSTGAECLADLTDETVAAWATGRASTRKLANNTVRGRLTSARSFLSWCHESGLRDAPMGQRLVRSVTRSFPATYGKAQSVNPARWLDRDEAFTTLLTPCQDGTDEGMRDELVLRLGLAGARCAEIANMKVGHIDLTTGTARWTGKGNRARSVSLGPRTRELLAAYLDRYSTAIGRKLSPADPIVCPCKSGARQQRHDLKWGTPVHGRHVVLQLVKRRADRSGLGHLTPHDLRRSAAGILHHDTDEHGAHRFDLLDIQKVLGHADPATTMRSYLDPLDTAVLDRASRTLD